MATFSGGLPRLWLALLPLMLATASCVPPALFAPRLPAHAGSLLGESSLSLHGVPLAGRPLECLTTALYYEARSEPDAGQRAVAQVVLNRVRHPAFPSTVCAVVFEGATRATGCQFSFTCDGSLGRAPSRREWARSRRIAREALASAAQDPIGWATHYHTRDVDPYWAPTLTRIGRVGAHIFYRWNGKTGEEKAFRRALPHSDTIF